MKNLFAVLLIILIGSGLFLATIRGVYGNPPASSIKNNLDQATKPFELSPERSRFLLTQNLSEHHSFALSKSQADAAFPDVGYYKGNFFIFFAPGMSLFALPFYNLGLQYHLSQVFSFSVVSIFAILNLIFIYLIGRHILKFPVWASLLSSLIFGFASISWGYATTLYQHHATVFFIIASFYAVWQYNRQKRWGWLWGIFVWINYALAILIDYPNAVLMFPVMVYFLIVSIKIKNETDKLKFSLRPAIILTSVFFVAITVLHGYYNYVNFGGWTKLSGSLLGYSTIVQHHMEKGNIENNIKKLVVAKDPVGFFKEFRIETGSNILLFESDKGIFIFNPVFLLGVVGIIYAFKRKDMNLEKNVLLSLILVNLLLYASWGDPWGGWAFGPRYLIPSMAILALFISYWLVHVKLKLVCKIITFLLIIPSVGISLLGALTTNAVPPLPEAVYLKSLYGFPYTIPFLTAGRSSSFMYNVYFAHSLSLIQYYIYLLSAVLAIIFIILFVLPYLHKKS